MRYVLDLRALRVVRAESCAPCAGGRGRAACALGAVMCCVLLVYGRGVMYAGGYAPCTALYAGDREGELCLLEEVEKVEVMRCVLLRILEGVEGGFYLLEVL